MDKRMILKRIGAFIVDYLLIALLYVCTLIILKNHHVFFTKNGMIFAISFIEVFFMIIVPVIFNGRTLGKMLLKVPKKEYTMKNIIIKYFIIYILLFLLPVILYFLYLY